MSPRLGGEVLLRRASQINPAVAATASASLGDPATSISAHSSTTAGRDLGQLAVMVYAPQALCSHVE